MNEYRQWLISQVEPNNGPDGYSWLCEVLHGIAFFPIMEMDWNRNDEALGLSSEWAESEGLGVDETNLALDIIEESHPCGFCTMLELFVVMARHMHFELMYSSYDRDISDWFKELIDNCGLGSFTNDFVKGVEKECDDRITELISTVIFRKYGWDGEGGMFPLSRPSTDQRDEELLVQMNNYIAERYDIC